MTSLKIYFPQWQSGAPNDSIAKGAEVIRRALHKNHNVNLVAIKVEGKIETDTRNDYQRNQIRQSAALASNFARLHRLLDQTGPNQTFCLGGDCGVELSLVSWWNSRSPNDFAGIWFDAHPDLNSVVSSPSGRFDGMVLRHLLDGLDIDQQPTFPALEPEQVILAGTRCYDDAEIEYIRDRGLSVVTCEELEATGVKKIMDLLRKREMSKFYIHIDVDVIDPGEFDCSTCLAPDGIGLNTLSKVVGELWAETEVKILGGGLVEITGDVAETPTAQEAMCRLFLRLFARLAA